jgi:lipopolysaccharide/colanic/teichoic acid biosynthesis glycosyltransferase
MIVRSRRKNETLISRIFGSSARFKAKQFSQADFLSEEQFQFELLKEIYRSDRRPNLRELGLIRMVFQGADKNRSEVDDQTMSAFAERLRITDSVGWYDSSLAFLLPETDKDGTLQVANAIAEIAVEHSLSVDTEVSIYPWDDELIALSNELKTLGEFEDESNDEPPSDQNGAHDSQNFCSSNRKANRKANRKSNGSGNGSAFVKTDKVDLVKHSFVKPERTPWWKRSVDIICSGTGILMLSPIFLVAALAIKFTSPGPIFFQQMREGKNGKPFGIYKFRTMVIDAEAKQDELRGESEQDGPAFKLTNDPRVTTVGKYLRKSCVDELPQLLNVLLGQMSLVGPRPLPVGESHACTAWQRARLTVLPGLTCTWQARGGRDVKFAQWMRMDLDYIERRSFWFDMKLIVETAFIALLHRGSV